MMKTKERQIKARVVIDDPSRQQGAIEEFDYDDDESYDASRAVKLLEMNQRDLPCPLQYREHFEHPSTREYIGFNFGWLSGSAHGVSHSKLFLSLALMSQFFCTFVAFLR
jgi:hypothetical protein